MDIPSEEREDVVELGEHNMRRWLRKQRIAKRIKPGDAPEQLADHVGPFITVSREEGAGAGEIVRRVGEKLGWEVLDGQLLDSMAEQYHTPRSLIRFVDETEAHWIYEVFGSWINRQAISQEQYVQRLGKIMLLAAHHGKAILVGRGAQYLLPRASGLAVRIIASREFRIDRVMRRDGSSREAARHQVQETDGGRRSFVHRYFHHEIADPDQYNLVLNAERLGTKRTADLLVSAVRIQFGMKGTPGSAEDTE
jgi:cytidylate kinase